MKLNLHPEIEYENPENIKIFQEKELQKLLIYLKERSHFYKRLFIDNEIDTNDILSIDDLRKIPFTTKDDLQKFNEDFYCVPKTEIVDYSTTSGTLGDPVTFGMSDRDLERLAYNEAISFAVAGIREGDLVQMMTTIDKRFMAGLAYFIGLRKMKASVIRMGPGIPALQWDSILRYQPKWLITVPSFLLKMIEYADHHGIDYNKSSVFGAVCIGESLRNQDFTKSELSKRITEKWNIKLFSTYASTEMSTAFTECEFQNGGHHHPELIITEIVDEAGNPVSDGESGELVITTLGVEAIPLLRYKTGDIVKPHYEKCGCGRTTMRLGPVLGRKQQMIKYKGTTLYPPVLNNILNSFEGISAYQIIIKTNEIGTDEILVKYASENISEELTQDIRDHFRAKLRVTPKVEIVDIDLLSKEIFNPVSRKPINFVDLRLNNC